jgi:hypothetical protein
MDPERVDEILEAARALLDSLDEEIEKKGEEKPLPPNVLESVERLRKFVKGGRA